MSDLIPFNRPSVVGRELEYVAASVANMHTSGDGPFARRCRDLLREELGAADVLLTPSCTAALEMCALLLDCGPQDEVIVPSFTFVSTVNAFALRGTTPVFVDIRPDTLNLDETRIEAALTPRTRAIALTHYGGVGCEMDAIRELATARGLAIVEDNAHGLFGAYRGSALGTLGALATLSFHETKNLICGEGGALVINDPSLVQRAEILHDKGTDRQRFFRGEVDRYTWVDLGSSYVLSDLLAAYLFAQLERREQIMQRRREIWQRYDAAFRGTLERHGVGLPSVPAHCEQTYHLYYLLLPSLRKRQALIRYLRECGIYAVFHYTPLHRSTMGRRLGRSLDDCPVTVRTSDRLVRLPLFHSLGADEQARVVDQVCRFFSGA